MSPPDLRIRTSRGGRCRQLGPDPMQVRFHAGGSCQRQRLRIGAGVLPTGDQFPAPRVHRRREPHPTRQPPPDRGPTLRPPSLGKAGPRQSHRMVHQHRQEQMPPDPWRLRAQIGRSPIAHFRLRKVASTSVNRQCAVGIQIVSCDSAHIVHDTERTRFSHTFVGEPSSPASLRHLSPCLGGPSGIDADACLARIISFRQEPPSGPV